MKPSRVVLWTIGAAMCAISVGFLFDGFGRDEQPSPIVEVSNSAPAQVLAATDTAETPQPEKPDVLDPAAQHSPHAIVPDAPQPSVPSTEVPTPQPAEPSVESPSPQATAPTAGRATPQAKEPGATPPMIEASPQTGQPSAPVHSTDDQSPTIVKDQLVTITSAAIVRDGPSSSAKIIGRAYAGAKARVAATDSGWAQVEDPASGNKGWVESRVLAQTTTETAATDEAPDVARDTWSEDQRAATSENRTSAGKSKHSAKAKRHRAEHHYRRRKFAFRFFIRGFLR